MRSEIMTVTPELAEKWLAQTTCKNRKLNHDAVNRYAQAMATGQWQVNGESVIRDDNGNVIDGRHRLSAVIKSRTSQKMVVVNGVDGASFKTIDSGRKRTHSDILTIEGIPNSKMVAAICSGIRTYEIDGEFAASVSPGKTAYTHRDPAYDVVKDVVSRLADLEEACSTATRWRKIVPGKCSAAFIGSIYYVLARVSKSDADKFFDSTIEMQFYGPSDPRKRLFENCTGRGKAEIMARDCRYAGAIFIKAWNAFREDKNLAFLRFYDNEEYPKPI